MAMSIEEFRESGYLQEVNRRFLHPLGLALSVLADTDEKDNMIMTLHEILDHRDDPCGIYYDLTNSDEERRNRFKKNMEFIDEQWEIRGKLRRKELGYVVEPCEGN